MTEMTELLGLHQKILDARDALHGGRITAAECLAIIEPIMDRVMVVARSINARRPVGAPSMFH